jgi:tetratricopeptide (TPR) repeat protein
VAVPVTLDVLPPGDAHALLAEMLGAERVAAEPAEAGELARLCAYLPLALRIAAANLGEGESIAAYAARLAASDDRLTALSIAGDERAAVRAAFELSFAGLPAPAQRMFRLLGTAPGPDVSLPAVASLAAVDEPGAKLLLDRLVAAHLVAEHNPGRYTLHDLLRVYATQLAHTTDTNNERRAATHRILDHYLHTASTAARLLNPGWDPITLTPPQPGVILQHLDDHPQALAWFTAERPVLAAAVDHAAATRFDTHTWQLALTVWIFLHRRGHWHQQLAIGRAAVAAAGRLADPTTHANVRRIVALAYTRLGRLDDAHAELGPALDLDRRAGNPVGQANTHHHLAIVWERRGDPARALDHARQSLDLYRAAGHPVGQARVLNAVGWFHALVGDHQQALTDCRQALTMLENLGDRIGQAAAWDSLGYAHHHLGQHTRAVTCYQNAIDLAPDLGDRYQEATTLAQLGDTHHAAGNPTAARDAYHQALAILDDLDHPDADTVRAQLATTRT